VRYQIGQMPTKGLQAINRKEGELLTGALLVPEDEELLLVTGGGYGRRLGVSRVPVPPKANTRGRVLVARRPVCGLARLGAGRRQWAITNSRWLPLDPDRLPAAAEDSTRSARLLKLAKGETVEKAISLQQG
jgi:hypothetical protein